MVPVKKADWKYLGMRVGNHIYIDRCLPMGASSSCQIFQRISDALAWIIISKCPITCHIFNYLDDFLFIASGRDNCNKALNYFSDVCRELGITLSPQKTIEASQQLVFLGIVIDTKNQCLAVPPEKASRTLDQLQQFLDTKKPKVLAWQKILGKLSFLTHVVPAGKPFLSSVYEALGGILSQDRHKRRRINQEAREDLNVWVSFLKKLPPGKQFKMFEADLEQFCIYTDASTSVGYGGVFGNNWFAGLWPTARWRSFNIAVLELYPIYAALHLWTESLSNSSVAIYTDNWAVVNIIRKLYTRDKQLRRLLKPITLMCLNNNIRISAYHIQGSLNVGPDLLSRGKVTEFLKTYPEASRTPTPIPVAHTPKNLAFMEDA
jgi:hypothetical protein